MFTSLPCFSSPGVRAAAARGVSILHSGLEGVFPTNLIPPNTELIGGRGIGSSTLTTPETFESCIPVANMFLRGGGISCSGGGMGCRNWLKRLLRACLLASVSLLQSRRETGWHANTIRYCCGGTSDFLPLCAFQRRPTLSNVFFGRRAASTG